MEDTHMSNPTPYTDTRDEAVARTVGAPNTYPGIPRWVKVSGIIVIVLVLLVGIVRVTGLGGMHGPMRHAPSSSGDGYTPAIAVGT